MSDLFHEDVPDKFIDKVWHAMAICPRHRFLILTKRPERMRAWVTENVIGIAPQIWLGTSVEDQKAADERIPHLLATPAAVRFISAEPLLGPVDLRRDFYGIYPKRIARTVDWVIVGGESGARARPMDLQWMRSLVEQCKSAGVPVFVKQLGADAIYSCEDESHPGEVHEWSLRESHGRDMSEWPEDLRVREFPR